MPASLLFRFQIFVTLLCSPILLFGQHSFASSDRTTVVAGGAHAAVIASDGTIWAWGYNGQGQLGQPEIEYSSTPVAIPAPFSPISLAAGFKSSLALYGDGNVWIWGGTETPLSDDSLLSPPIQQLPVTGIKTIAMGPSEDTLMIRGDGTVWTWSPSAYKPTMLENIDEVAGIGVGLSSFFAFKYDCTLLSWGKNNFGQLGDGSNQNQVSPTPSAFFACLSRISADNHTVALDSAGHLWTWGYNHEGQLGDGSTRSSTTPHQLEQLSNIVDIDTDSHSLALKSNGTVWAWGLNNFGQLGDGTTTDRHQPVQVAGLNRVTAVAAGAMFSIAVKSDGSVWAWGLNNYGQLGNGTLKNSSIPVQVLNGDGNGFLNINTTPADKIIPPVFFTTDPTRGEAPLRVVFEPMYVPEFKPKSLEWDFGDGDTSSLSSPVHIYEAPGSYIATLTARYPGDIYRESMKQIVVKTSW